MSKIMFVGADAYDGPLENVANLLKPKTNHVFCSRGVEGAAPYSPKFQLL